MKAQEELTLELIYIIRIFAMLINAGINIRKSLAIIADKPQSPYTDAMKSISEKVDSNQTLSTAMQAHPDLFPPVLVIMVRAGEVGGLLDETMRYVADLLEEGWKFAQLSGSHEHFNSLFMHRQHEKPETWDAMPEEQRLFLSMMFFRSFGWLLSSGVPILQAMEVSGEMLPRAQQAAWMEMREGIREGGRLSLVAFQPAFAQTMAAIGEETGSLDRMMLMLADTYHHLLEVLLWKGLRRS